MDKLIAAALLGLSLNYFMCIFLGFGMSSVDAKLAAKFIIGRLFGLVTLGVLISILGNVLYIPPDALRLAFGIMCAAFGAWLLVKKGCMPHPNVGFGLGLLRGMTPCVKIVLVIPMIYGSGIPEAISIMLVFGLFSSVYPAIGMLFGGAIAKLPNAAGGAGARNQQCASCESCGSCSGSKGAQARSCSSRQSPYARMLGAFILILMGLYYIFRH